MADVLESSVDPSSLTNFRTEPMEISKKKREVLHQGRIAHGPVQAENWPDEQQPC